MKKIAIVTGAAALLALAACNRGGETEANNMAVENAARNSADAANDNQSVAAGTQPAEDAPANAQGGAAGGKPAGGREDEQAEPEAEGEASEGAEGAEGAEGGEEAGGTKPTTE